MKITAEQTLFTPAPARPAASSLAQESPSAFPALLKELNSLQGQADGKVRLALQGREDLHEAMLSLERASLGLKVLVQVRNRMVQAYEELSRITM
jgi:flagellar hook-basal body complex protein FliE